MKEYPIYSPQTRTTETKPLDHDHAYGLPYTEWEQRISVVDGTVVGSDFVKTRIIVEHPLPKAHFGLSRRRLRKTVEERLGESHFQIESIMRAQEIMLEIHAQVIKAIHQVYTKDDDPDTQAKRWLQEIAEIGIPEILAANALDISAAKGKTEFARAGFLVGFMGRGKYGLTMREDEERNLFLENKHILQ